MAAAKESIRLRIRSIRDAISPVQAADAAEAAAARLLTLAPVKDAEVVALYAPVRSELDTGPAASALRDRGVVLAYPRVLRGARRLRFHRVTDPSTLQPGTYGIPEPPAAAPVIPVERIDVFLIPGLAFDPTGARLGWGKGYYDATLAHRRGAPAPIVGYAYECQLVEEVPREARDVPVSHIVTEARVIRCRPSPDG